MTRSWIAILSAASTASTARCAETRTVDKPYTEDFVGAPLSIAGLRHPGSTLLLVDAGYSLICWWQAAAEPPVALGDLFIDETSYVPGLEINEGRYLWPGQTSDAIGGRHPNKTVNIGFADGHAELQPARNLLVEKGKDGAYSNMVLWQGQQSILAGTLRTVVRLVCHPVRGA